MRETDQENISKELEKAISKELRVAVVKNVLKPVFESVDIKYDAKSVSQWIARGHLSRVSLNSRIEKYDKLFFNLVSGCQELVFGKEYAGDSLIDRIVSSRNYYSHLKKDNDGLLALKEIYECSNILLALITSILLNRIGFEIEGVKNIMNHDAMYGVYVHLDEIEGPQPEEHEV